MNYFRFLLVLVFIFSPFILGFNEHREHKKTLQNEQIQSEIKKISDMNLGLYETGYLVQEVYFKHGLFTEENIAYKRYMLIEDKEIE